MRGSLVMQRVNSKQARHQRGLDSRLGRLKSFDGSWMSEKNNKDRLSIIAQRTRDQLEGGILKKEINKECGGRFKEILQELAEEHIREIETERAAFGEQLRMLRVGAQPVPESGLNSVPSVSSASANHYSRSATSPVSGSVFDKAALSKRPSIAESVQTDARTLAGRCSGAAPRPPTEPPPILNMPVLEPLSEVPQDSDHPLEGADVELTGVVPSPPSPDNSDMIAPCLRKCDTQETVLCNRDTLAISNEDGGADYKFGEESLPHGGRRAIMNVDDVAARWAKLVYLAVNVASVDMHFPRQVWKSGLQSKRKGKDQLAHSASKHIKKMCSSVSGPYPKTRKGNTVIFHLVEGIHHSKKCEALDPHAGPRLAWTVVAVLFMVYDLVFVPMQLFNPPYDLGFYVIDLSAQVYWTLDMFMCFVTGVYVKSVLERRFSKIASIYARSWLTFDLLVTVPQWYSLIAGQKSPISNLKGIRFVRMLRFLRLARLAKFEHVLREALEVINSPYVLLVISIVKLMLCLLWFNHVICCIWFHIGSGSNGWVNRGGLDESSIWYQYLSSIHWALTQFQGTSEIVPGTTVERGYAVIFLLMALILLAAFVSSLTNNMRALKELHNENNAQQRAVRSYLSENGISTHLCVQVNRYVEWNRRQKHRKQQDAEVLLVLPTKLLMDLYDEVRGPLLGMHPFFCTFRNNFIRVQRRVCYEALEQSCPCPSELVYAEGDECFCMYFIMCGQLRYEPHPAALGRVPQTQLTWEEEIDMEDIQVLDNVLESSHLRAIRVGQNEWMSEPVLWTEWEHCGDLIGLEECALLLLNAGRFADIVKTFTAARTMASLYARNFVVCLNRFGHTFTDVINHSDLFDYEDADGTVEHRFSSTDQIDTIFSCRSSEEGK